MLQHKGSDGFAAGGSNFISKERYLSVGTGPVISQNLSKIKNKGWRAVLKAGSFANNLKRCEITFFDEGSRARETKRYKFKYYFKLNSIFLN